MTFLECGHFYVALRNFVCNICVHPIWVFPFGWQVFRPNIHLPRTIFGPFPIFLQPLFGRSRRPFGRSVANALSPKMHPSPFHPFPQFIHFCLPFASLAAGPFTRQSHKAQSPLCPHFGHSAQMARTLRRWPFYDHPIWLSNSIF